MITYLLIVCTSVHNGVQCLPPIPVRSEAQCVSLGKAYLRTARLTYDEQGRYEKASVRCLRVAS